MVAYFLGQDRQREPIKLILGLVKFTNFANIFSWNKYIGMQRRSCPTMDK